MFTKPELRSPGYIFYRFIVATTAFGIKVFRGPAVCQPKVTAKRTRVFQIIHLIFLSSHPVNEFGVTQAGLWPCIFCRSIVALRRSNYQSNSLRPLRFCQQRKTYKQKSSFKLSFLLNAIINQLSRSELLKPGCGRAYSVA